MMSIDFLVTTLIIVVSPGTGVVAQAVRSGGRKRKRGDLLQAQVDREWRERLKRQSDRAD